MKAVKIIGKILIGIVAFVVVALLTTPLWIGAVVKPVANSVVPKYTGTKFNLGEFALNPYVGRLALGDAQLYNPTGYEPEMAFTLGRFFADVDMSTVMSDVIVIEKLHIKDVFVSYAKKDGVSNFDVMLEKAKGKGEVGGEGSAETKGKQGEDAQATKKQKKVIIDELVIEGVLGQWGKMTLPLPSVTLKNIGRDTQGATWSEVWQKASAPIMKGFSLLGDGANALGGLIGDGTKSAVKSAKDLGANTKNAAKDIGTGATKAVGGALDSVGSGAKGAAESAGKALKGLFGK